MNQSRPLRGRLFTRRLIQLGFNGPYSGTRHHFMVYENHLLSIPSNSEYSVPQLRMMVKEAESILNRSISASEWNRLE